MGKGIGILTLVGFGLLILFLLPRIRANLPTSFGRAIPQSAISGGSPQSSSTTQILGFSRDPVTGELRPTGTRIIKQQPQRPQRGMFF